MLKTSSKNYFAYEMIGEFISRENWIHPVRIIDTYELIFVLDGCVHIKEDNEKYDIAKNECIILEPNKKHGGYKESSETSFYWFHFKTDFKMPFKTYKEDKYYDIKYLLKKLLHMSNTLSYEKSALDAAALLIFGELENAVRQNSGSSFINKASEYVRINTNKNITAKSVADYFGYNADYISRLFKKTFGVSLKKYITDEKIKYAKDLLLNTGLSVKQIAANLGFSYENNFIKFFIYHEEITPVQFRNKYFKIHMNNK